MKKLAASFYQNTDVVETARHLTGKILATKVNNKITTGRITEVEAYRGFDDRACHAAGGKTPRNAPMFESGGIAYVYLCYGIHSLFNVVTGEKGRADAVLIRAVEPLTGIPIMVKRRKFEKVTPELTNGPGKLTAAMGITLDHNRISLLGDEIRIEDDGFQLSDRDLIASHRVGVNYAGKDALKNWRFRIRNNPFTGKDHVGKAER